MTKYRIMADEDGFWPQKLVSFTEGPTWVALTDKGLPVYGPDRDGVKPKKHLLHAEAIIGRAAIQLGKPE